MSDLGVFDPDLYANGDPWRSGLPLDLFAELREERPCYWQPLEAEPMFVDGVWVVSRYADVVAVICDTPRFSNQAGISVRRFDPTRAECGGKPTMMSMDGIQHRNNRTVTHRLFSRRAVNTFAEKFRTIAAMLVERALDREVVDFIGDIARYMPLHAVSELLGIPAEDREQVLAWTNLITVPLDPHFTPSHAEFEQALDGLWRYGLRLSGLRGTEPDESIMSAIARGHANGVLSDDEVSGYMLALAAARRLQRDACRQRPCGVRHLGAYLPRPACREARTQDPVRGAAAPGAGDRACRQGRVHSRQSGPRHPEDADNLRWARLNRISPRT